MKNVDYKPQHYHIVDKGDVILSYMVENSQYGNTIWTWQLKYQLPLRCE